MKDIAKIIDQTFLKKNAGPEEIKQVCKETKEYRFRGLCLFPEHTSEAAKWLANSGIKIITLVDEPTGISLPSDRLAMTKKAKEEGSDEVDLVMKIDDFKNGRYDQVLTDLQENCRLLPIKVIIGSGYLTDEEITKASAMVKQAGAICVKTATLKDPLDRAELPEKAKHIRLMKEAAPGLLIKASGSIRTFEDVKKMVAAGADIIGTSSGVEIVNEAAGRDNEDKNEAWRKVE